MHTRAHYRMLLALFFLGVNLNINAQDLKTIGKDKDALTKQAAEIDSIVKKLQDCVNQTTFASKKDLCQRAKDFRDKQRALISEKLELLELQRDPTLLTARLKTEVEGNLNLLDSEYAALTGPAEGAPARGTPSAPSAPKAAGACKPDKDHPCLNPAMEWDYSLSGALPCARAMAGHGDHLASGAGTGTPPMGVATPRDGDNQNPNGSSKSCDNVKPNTASEVMIDGLSVGEPVADSSYIGNPLIDAKTGSFTLWLAKPLYTGQRVRVRFLNGGQGDWSDEMVVQEYGESDKSAKDSGKKPPSGDASGNGAGNPGNNAGGQPAPPAPAPKGDGDAAKNAGKAAPGSGTPSASSSKKDDSSEYPVQTKPEIECAIPVTDCRNSFESSAYLGVGIDTFASSQVNSILNPEQSSAGPKERAVAGFDFEYRLLGAPRVTYDEPRFFRWNSQLWVFGETVHGVRSTDIDCKKNSSFPTCKNFPTSPSGSGEEFLFVLRNASTLEGFSGFRWEFATLQPRMLDPANLFVKAQAGFLSVSGRPGSAAAIHHLGIGALATKGWFEGSYLEVGHGRNDLVSQKRNGRWLVDAYLTRPIWRGVSGFAQITVDTDLGKSADVVQSYIGFEFNLRNLFAKTTKPTSSSGTPPSTDTNAVQITPTPATDKKTQ